MRKLKPSVLPSTFLAAATRAAILSAASTMLLFVSATATSAEPAKAPPGAEVVDPSTADSETEGTEVSGPDNGSEFELLWESCLTQGSTGNIACFEDYGDKFYVYDGDADGASAAAYWWTDYGRSGICYNSNQAGTWAECNYNMREDGVVYWQTCYQNRSAGGNLVCTSTVVWRYINGD
jgi:hypothetical protein